ncbi:f-box only protein 21, partial [Lasius niger]
MAAIMCLPVEVIVIFLRYNDITIEDFINFRCVCKKFRLAAKYDKHWEEKVSQ